MSYASRIKEYRTVASRDLTRHPLNFRRHPETQRAALRGLLSSVGRVAPILAYQDSSGALVCLDGHARLDESDEWDVAILDIDEHEAAAVLAMLDKIGSQAEIDPDTLLALLDTLPQEARQTAGAAWSDDELARLIAQGQPMPTMDELWKGMPEFEQEDQAGYQSVHVHFKTKEDVEAFSRLINQTITDKTRAIWYPQAEKTDMVSEVWASES